MALTRVSKATAYPRERAIAERLLYQVPEPASESRMKIRRVTGVIGKLRRLHCAHPQAVTRVVPPVFRSLSGTEAGFFITNSKKGRRKWQRKN